MLLEGLEEVVYMKGEFLVREGEFPDGMYLLKVRNPRSETRKPKAGTATSKTETQNSKPKIRNRNQQPETSRSETAISKAELRRAKFQPATSEPGSNNGSTITPRQERAGGSVSRRM